MAYQAGNPWLRPKPAGSRRSLRALKVLPGRQQGKFKNKCSAENLLIPKNILKYRLFFFLSFFICYLPSPNVQSQPLMPVAQMPVGGARTLNQNTRQIRTREGLHEICSQQNVRVTARENTGQNTQRSHPIQG